ncbi:MAG: helix-turn-helix transcriptional regulator [Oceanicaulis sp.]
MTAPLTNRIRVLRAEENLSQTKLAEAIGVSRKTIRTIETRRFVPSTVISLRVARHFGATVEDVFSLTDRLRGMRLAAYPSLRSSPASARSIRRIVSGTP